MGRASPFLRLDATSANRQDAETSLARIEQLISERAQAEALLNTGRQALRDGSYLDAIELLKQAYELTPDPGLTYDIAMASFAVHHVDQSTTSLLVSALGLPPAPLAFGGVGLAGGAQ